MRWAPWHLAAVVQLDAAGAEQVLLEVLPAPEYAVAAAEEMARALLPKPERAFDRTFPYELMWAAREGRQPPSAHNERRIHYAAALNGEIKRLLRQRASAKSTGPIDYVLQQLAKALAAVDGRGSAATVFDVISLPGERDEWARVDAAERLLASGVVLPSAIAFGLVDAVLAQTERYGMQGSDRYLLQRTLSLCVLIDEPAKGIAKVGEVIAKGRLAPYELREIVTAAGKSRSAAAVDFLSELASHAQTFEQCEDNLINALASLDTPHARERLLGFVDPDVRGIGTKGRLHREDVLVARIVELATRDPSIASRLRKLSDRDLPDLSRHILSKVMNWLATPDALAANLNLMDDSKRPPIPQGAWDQIEAAFLERRPYRQSQNMFTQEARASNELRKRLFQMAGHDEKRRKAAFSLLGQIEEWRLEHGRPTGEPRHPDFASREPWPPEEPDA